VQCDSKGEVTACLHPQVNIELALFSNPTGYTKKINNKYDTEHNLHVVINYQINKKNYNNKQHHRVHWKI
jgi:hypothetical protein